MQRPYVIRMFKVKRLLLFLGLLLMPSAALADCVIFLHGYSRSATSFSIMSQVFSQKGYQTVKIGYASLEDQIPTLAKTAIPEAIKQCEGDNNKIHFVTHSLGGILLRKHLADHEVLRLGRSVMLGSPNQGAKIVDKLEGFEVFNKLSGPALKSLRTGTRGAPANLPPVTFELGVIAGTRSLNPVGSLLIDGPSDGAVSVETTKVKGMKDHIILPVTHTLMMNNPMVISQTIRFIEGGKFDHGLNLLDAVKSLSKDED